MSTQNRSGGGGGRNKMSKASTQQKELQKDATLAAEKGGNSETAATNVSQKGAKTTADHVKEPKEKPQMKQPTAEQIRIAQITDIKGGIEDPKIREKVEKLMEMTQRSEEDVCCALYECDNDLDRAVMFLFEQLPVGAFATTSKKKKNRQANNADGNAADGDWNNENAAPNSSKDDKGRGGNRGNNQQGSRGGRGGRDGARGGGSRRGDGDRNGTSNFKVDTFRGERRGGDGNRREGRDGNSFGGRGGSRGARSDNRDNRERGNYRGNRPNRNQEDASLQQIDSWEPVTAETQKQEVQIDTWGDWDNEEYTGSLKDTKVFTPSTSTTAQSGAGAQQQQSDHVSAPPGLNPPASQIDSYSSAITSGTQQQQQTAASVVAGGATNAGAATNQSQYPEIHSGTTAAQHLRQALEMPQIQSSTLSAEQSQYFNTLSSQNSNSYQTSGGGVQYGQPTYGAAAQYGTAATVVDPTQQGQRRPPARARVPPPSKIPSTAVEMPGDALNNIGYLDVQFGGLDFGTDDSFENVTDKFGAATLDSSANAGAADDYQNKSGQKNTLAGAQLQNLSQNDNLASQSDNLASYTQRSGSNVPSSVNSGANNYGQLGKATDPYGNQTNANATGTGYQSNSYSSQTKTPSYQATQGYGSGYSSSAQVSSNNNFPPASNTTYNSYNQSYQQQQQNSTTTGSNAASGVSNNNTTVPVNSSSVNNNSANTNSGYLSNQYPGNVPSSTYPSQQNAYQTSNQSVYGNSGLSNSAGFSSSTNTSNTTGQYNNFSSKLKDTTVSTPFDSTSSTSVSSSTVTSSVSTSNMSSPSLGLSNTKVTNSTAKSGTTVVPNIPMVGQYIQTPGMPYYQPQVYSYEDMQLMQQRVSHMPGYYENFIQAPTSLTGAGAAGVRDANLSSMAYSTMSDARFARTDNNSSPVSNVPSTMSQQSGSGGHMVPFAYYYPGNNAMMPGGYQFSTPIYQQVATPNATSGGQFPKPSYNSGYGSTSYDTLNQTTQDYNKTPYASSGVGQQSKGQTVSNPQTGGTGSDITSSMYGKSHAALNKSYEKQSFHSGTPPPFNLVGSQTALNNVNAASAQAYGSQHLYIPTIAAPHHNMNMHQPHQMDGLGRVYYNSNDIYSANTLMQWDSSSTGQRQQSNSQGKSATKQGYSPSYWTAQN
ncbi:protein lingerer isoform X3 [Culicoides brevitarsis]|uniref:protein lingerer isoform X3 n=1 Tax=Culicoides brevitarsis TaxID=469753 RepID=UPI00307BB4E7